MRRTSLFWAIALIALGTLLLLRETFDAWRDVSAGGLILIAVGAWLLFERAGQLHVLGARSIVAIVLIGLGVVILLRDLGILPEDISAGPIVLIAIGAALLVTVLSESRAVPVSSQSIPLDGAASGAITIHHAAGRLLVGPTAQSGLLLSGTFAGGVDARVHRTGDRVEAVLRQRWQRDWWGGWRRYGTRGFEWAVSLNREVPLSMQIRTGASSVRLELEDLLVADLTLETGASQTEMVVPARGHTAVRVHVGAAQLRIRIPAGVAARIRARKGLAAMRVDTSRFPQTAEGFRSPDYDAAEDRVDLDVEAGAAEVTVS